MCYAVAPKLLKMSNLTTSMGESKISSQNVNRALGNEHKLRLSPFIFLDQIYEETEQNMYMNVQEFLHGVLPTLLFLTVFNTVP